MEKQSIYRAALYLRVSKEEIEKKSYFSNSIENQKRFLLEYLKKKPEVVIYDCYIERKRINLIQERDFSKEVVQTSKEEFQAEKMYQISLFIAKSMLEEDIISKKEFAEIDAKLLEKYRPILGTLLAGKALV